LFLLIKKTNMKLPYFLALKDLVKEFESGTFNVTRSL
jgi:hypothetical protein